MRPAFESFAAALGTPRPLGESHIPPVALLQDFYRAIARRDYAAVGALLTHDVIFELSGLPGVPPEPLVGYDTVLAAFQASFEAIEPIESKVETLVSRGNQLVLIATDRGTYPATSTPYSVRFILELTFREQQMSHIREWVFPLPQSPL